MNPQFRRSRRLVVGGLLLAAVSIAAGAYAQQIIRGGGGGRFAPRWATAQSFDGKWNYCRGFYSSDYREAGGSGWSTDFPAADNNFSVRLAELTYVPVKLGLNRQPDHVVVRLTDPLLFHCPMLFMEDVGTASLSSDEIQNLRTYLLKGGMLWVDDFWGSLAWERWQETISSVLPPGEYPIFDIPPTHPIMHTLYNVPAIPQVSSIQFWYQSGGDISERGYDSSRVDFRGIADERGRLMVIMTHNTDIADTWEREGESREYFDRFSPDGYAVGVNVVLYALTH
jgi:hypothetical protein